VNYLVLCFRRRSIGPALSGINPHRLAFDLSLEQITVNKWSTLAIRPMGGADNCVSHPFSLNYINDIHSLARVGIRLWRCRRGLAVHVDSGCAAAGACTRTRAVRAARSWCCMVGGFFVHMALMRDNVNSQSVLVLAMCG
jgi:hypothetical protein